MMVDDRRGSKTRPYSGSRVNSFSASHVGLGFTDD